MNPRLYKMLLAGALMASMALPAWGIDEAPGAVNAMPSMGSANENPIYRKTPDELWRREVFDRNGEKIGTIRTVVRSQVKDIAHAVITDGGIMGYGAREISVPLNRLQLVDGKLRIDDTRESLHANNLYMPGSYVELKPDRPISEFSAFEPQGPAMGSGTQR